MFFWLSNPSGRINRICGMYWFSIAFWSFFVGTQSYTIPRLSGFWWGWFLHLGCTYIPVLLFHSVIIFTRHEISKFHIPLISSYALATLFNLLNLWTKSFTTSTMFRDAYAYPKPALLYPLYFVFFVALVIWSTLLMVKRLGTLSASENKGLQLILITHILAYLGGMDNFLIMADLRFPPLYPFGLYLIPFYALATIYVAHHYHLFRSKVPATE